MKGVTSALDSSEIPLHISTVVSPSEKGDTIFSCKWQPGFNILQSVW